MKERSRSHYPLPRLDSCLESLGGNRIFSTLDLRAGYWQTELDPSDAEKTAFITRSGQYKFTRFINKPGEWPYPTSEAYGSRLSRSALERLSGVP
jgi:hypothetical protein